MKNRLFLLFATIVTVFTLIAAPVTVMRHTEGAPVSITGQRADSALAGGSIQMRTTSNMYVLYNIYPNWYRLYPGQYRSGVYTWKPLVGWKAYWRYAGDTRVYTASCPVHPCSSVPLYGNIVITNVVKI